MNKKGALTDAQIVMIVLAIVGFLIVLGFIGYLNFVQQSTQDICHLSVIGRATAPTDVQGLVPLKCTTSKICITDGNEKCTDSFAGEKDITVVSLSGTNDEKARTIDEVSANAMYDCWSTMGEGKVTLFGSYAKKRNFNVDPGSSCVICSRVAVDASVNDVVLQKVDINKYMKENKVQGSSLTYLQTFTDSSINAYPYVDKDTFSSKYSEVAPDIEVIPKDRQIAFTFMQIRTTSWPDSLKELGKDGAIAVAGGTFVGSAIGGPSGFILSLKSSFSAAKKSLYALPGTLLFTGLNSASSKLIAAGYCGAFVTNVPGETGTPGEQGCSIVQATPYSLHNINSLCDVLEGNP